MLLRATELHGDDAGENVELVRSGAALKIGRRGPRILRLCADPAYPRVSGNIIPIGFPALPEPKSLARFELLREWLSWCDANHSCNKHNTESQAALPTRLIYVGNSDPEVLRLYVPEQNERVKYTALSHRWGEHPPTKTNPWFCTTDNNIDARLEEFKISELPKTFHDAIQVTRELRIKYLWIDSLCIIQWNLEDWKREADRMEGVFASAYCTIAATLAVDSSAGFLARNRSAEYMLVQDASGKPFYVCDDVDDFDQDVENAQLNTRAWVMQERVLARRTIHFSTNQTYWECGEGVYCENLTKMKSSFRKKYFLLDPNFPSRLLESGKQRTVEFIHFLFEEYSRRNLTERTDRCVAVSGLEARIAGALQCESRYGIFQKHLHRNLLWRASDNKMERITYDNNQEVPSWSWMAYSGGIRFMDIEVGSIRWLVALRFDKERKAALITNLGRFRDCTKISDGGRHVILKSSRRERGWIQYDVENVTEIRHERCVVVGLTKGRGSKGYCVLVVVPNGVYGEYRRIGVGMIPTACVQKETTDVQVV